ncbi:MAG: COQ9 family protein [Paenirhodobacter sp.]|uniref:COQ9 family protein n=1 Tax=Paenirhodobacter sp. TaxID=1965326 RepID=UPI003D14794E
MKNDHLDVARAKAELLAAIMPHVPFDGWSDPAFDQAVRDLGLEPRLARLVCPRGAVDLAVEYHRAADRALVAKLAETTLEGLKFREKVAAAVRMRLELVDPELVRRAASVFALPQHAATGARLVWETADVIWRALGDTSEDYNWYSKRLTLAGVISSTVLYWMGDESEGHAKSWEFLDGRIGDVMQFEKVKGAVMKLPFVGGLLGAIRAPGPSSAPGTTGEGA